MRKLAPPLITVVALLAGCGEGVEATPQSTVTVTAATASASEETAATPTPEPSPEPTYASEAQIASIIGKDIKDWQAVIDAAGECRIMTVMADEDDPLESAQKRICLTNEATMSMTARQASVDLMMLEAPPSMEDLVEETMLALYIVAEADVNNGCHAAGADPDSDRCAEALGNAFYGYQQLDAVLGGWSPYL